MNTLIEIHALQNFAPSNLNRDDTGAPKDSLFGGSRRARVSSQCIKRAVRQYFGQKVADGLMSGDDLAVRTKLVYQAIADLLKDRRDEAEARAKAEIALAYLKISHKDNGKTQYLMFLGRRELAELAEVIDAHWDDIVAAAPAEEGASSKGRKKAAAKGAPPAVKKRLETVLNGGKAVDVALFGRMLADMPEKNTDGACQVAHAISTHAIEREFDFFTAVDDLRPDDTNGSDMMGTVEFNSACYYRYANINYDLLVNNLQGDAELAQAGLRTFLEAFVTSNPTGKQNTFAAHNPPEFIAISVRRKAAPRNYANAFESAVRVRAGESLTRKSAEALAAKARDLQAVFGGEEQTFVINLAKADLGGYGAEAASLDELLARVIAAVQG